ncbi:MAG: hypothetical protein SGPRY_007957, partial [Prymnesium sp.]
PSSPVSLERSSRHSPSRVRSCPGLSLISQCALITANCLGMYHLGGLWQFVANCLSFLHMFFAFTSSTNTCLAALHHVLMGVCAITGVRYDIDVHALLRCDCYSP